MDSTRKLPLNIDTDTEDEEPILVANVHRTVKIGPNGTRMIEIVETNDRGKTRSVRRNLQIPAGKGRGISGAEQTALAEEQAYELFLQDSTQSMRSSAGANGGRFDKFGKGRSQTPANRGRQVETLKSNLKSNTRDRVPRP
ncbi:uncharacterized protein LOC119649669 [Hermetia illucens]|uniref:uncharacterized protein LOC119649669 n=1 Tax=Hermetia illucens TaxID=343691 RepID=UPI0018CC3BBE|nr:uncharacterized protein LOC119649669 [Hermetia illucens]